MAPTEQQLKHAKSQQLAGLKKVPKARVQRYLKRTVEPALIEKGGKSTLLFQGIACSASMLLLLKELKSIRAPASKLLSKKNNIIPFSGDMNVGESSIEFLCTKNDCALFAMGTHNKKRPNNLIIGRLFNHQILDKVELGIVQFKSMKDYGGTVPKKRIGSKPLLLFVGDLWQHDVTYKNLQNLLIDFYRGDVVDKFIVSGVDHIITFNAVATNTINGSGNVIVHQRSYFIKLKKNVTDPNSNTPVPLLTPCGPDIDFTVRRTAWADASLASLSRKQSSATSKGKKKLSSSSASKMKNQSTNMFGETLGRLHLVKQNVDGRQTGRKMKSLKRAESAAKQNELQLIEQELQQEKEE